jgi:predicted NAD/FAD-dependent oxidoreductase
MTSSAETRPVLIVGAGISGLACARALRAAGVATRVVERGRVVGGRMASRRLDGRPVDLGAAFFTADLSSPFGTVVRDWLDRGLARPWTDTLSVSEPGHPLVTKSGPLRYAAPGGLRSLLTDLAEGLEVELEQAIDSIDVDSAVGSKVDTVVDSALGSDREHSAVVLAMPDPQARRLLPAGSAIADRLGEGQDWAPTIAVALGWPERRWPADFHGAFVNGSPVLSFLADDGDRRGDGAPVLVAHSSAELAREHLEIPDAAIPPIIDAVRALLELGDAPSWSYAHRWTFARPLAQHPEPFLLEDGGAGLIGVCGDAWGANSSVGTAWSSGDALGRALAAALG